MASKSRINDTAVPLALAIAGVAAIAVLFANKANSSGLIQSIGSAFSNSLGVAIGGITGASSTINTSYPTNQL